MAGIDTNSTSTRSEPNPARSEIDSTRFRQTLELLASWPDPATVVPVVAAGLEDASTQDEALDLLLSLSEHRAPREIIRRYDQLHESQKARARSERGADLEVAAEQLLRSSRAQTRQNVGAFLEDCLCSGSPNWSKELSSLLILVDDPQIAVRRQAREAFFKGIARVDSDSLRKILTPQHPILIGLTILLRRFEQHEDRNVITSLFQAGPHGIDALSRAISDGWRVQVKILELLNPEKRGAVPAPLALAAVLRWLTSPLPRVREEARRIARDRTDAAFLSEAARTLSQLEAQDEKSQAALRYFRWEALPLEDFAQLPETQQLLVIGLIQTFTEDRAGRLSRFLGVSSSRVRKQILQVLREHSLAPPREHLLPLLRSEDPEIQRLATDQLDPEEDPSVYPDLIEQLKSETPQVRELAQKKLTGHGFDLFREVGTKLSRGEQRQFVRLVERIDTYFYAEIRRTLKSGDEAAVILALRCTEEVSRLEPLEDALFDLTVTPNPRIRATLTRPLVRVGEQAAIHYLRLFTRDLDHRVVANAIEALVDLRDPGARAVLIEFRRHGNPRVRINALLGLHQLGDSTAAVELTQLASPRTPGPFLRSARWGLSQIGGESEPEIPMRGQLHPEDRQPASGFDRPEIEEVNFG